MLMPVPEVPEATRLRIARHGPDRLLGAEYRDRQNMEEAELLALFDACWPDLRQGLERAEEIEPASAERLLTEKEQAYFKPQLKHLHVRCRGAQFLAQVVPTAQRLDQLWHIKSGDAHPRVLWVTFETVEERQAFRDLAGRLGWNDENLGLELIRDFMRKHQRLK